MRLDPRFGPETLRMLSVSLFHQKRYQESIDVIDRIIAQGGGTTDEYSTKVSALGHLGQKAGLQETVAVYDKLAASALFDPLTVQESYWFWNGDTFFYHRPYIDDVVNGLRKAGLPEGAGTDQPLDSYKKLMTRKGGAYFVEGTQKIDAEALQLLKKEGAIVIDVRSNFEYRTGHVPGAINLSLVTDLSKESLARAAAPASKLVFYCHGKYCPYSAYASAKALVWGYRRVYYFAGGFPEWKEVGLPISKI